MGKLDALDLFIQFKEETCDENIYDEEGRTSLKYIAWLEINLLAYMNGETR